jgi:SagB-type dehydrogenase family enzyme
LILSSRQGKIIDLPNPFLTGGLPLSEAISQRRSIRAFSPEPLLLFQLSEILWAAQGITSSQDNLRAIPSAGGTYPLELYVVIGENGIEQTDSGVYHYEAGRHILTGHIEEDIRWELSEVALGQDFIAVAPASLIICALYDRTLARYSARGERYVFMEAGHAGQNVYLQATALGLGTVAVGAFHDTEVRNLLHLDKNTRPLYIMPLGKPAVGEI